MSRLLSVARGKNHIPMMPLTDNGSTECGFCSMSIPTGQYMKTSIQLSFYKIISIIVITLSCSFGYSRELAWLSPKTTPLIKNPLVKNLIVVLLLSAAVASQAQPIYLAGERVIRPTELVSESPPATLLKTLKYETMLSKNSEFTWYRFDIQRSTFLTTEWLMVFRQAPYMILDVFVPHQNGYLVKKLGMDADFPNPATSTIRIDQKPGELKTYYIRYHSIIPNPLTPEFWPTNVYHQQSADKKIALITIQTLLLIAAFLIFIATYRKRLADVYMLTSHMLATAVLISMWQGEIFRVAPWLGDSGRWLIVMTTLVLITATNCYRSLAMLSVYAPKTDRIALVMNTIALLSVMIYLPLAESNQSLFILDLAAFMLLASLATVVLASGYCLYNGIRPARLVMPASLVALLMLSLTYLIEPWPSSLPSYHEILLLSLHAAILPFYFWYRYQQNLNHTIAISATTQTDQKRRVFEMALREHLHKPEAPLTQDNIPQRILKTFADVLPSVPTMILIHDMNRWEIIGDYSSAAKSLRSQIPAIEKELFHAASSGVDTRINFKDQFGNTYWAFPLSIEDDYKALLILAPPRNHRNSANWQTASDISYHACTLFQASRQTRVWQQQASLDPLTGLLNRRSFSQEAEAVISKSAKKSHGLSCCALFMDIDNFKKLNDRLGHKQGDRILKQTATTCRNTLRIEDLLCRYGGDEFVALLPCTKPWQAFQAAERIRSRIEKEVTSFDDDHTAITLSIGLAAMSSRISNLDKLLETADSAMYQAKKQGKNQIFVSATLPYVHDNRLTTT